MITTLTHEAVLEGVEARIAEVFAVATARAGRHSPEFVELWARMRAAAIGGKRLRPRLVVHAGIELGGAPLGPLIDVAAATELLHTALLLHDDVIDGDLERRGRPNLIADFTDRAQGVGVAPVAALRWGRSAAILAGDLLIAGALRLAADLDVEPGRRARLIALLDESVFRAAAGELADIAYATGAGTPTPAEIHRMMSDKTGHYSAELPLRAGAILSGAPAEVEDALGSIGRSLGIVFQMRDDLLGVFGSKLETGKSDTSDLREGKQTLLVALARGTDAWEAAAHRFGREDLDDDGAAALRAALVDSGARAGFEAVLAAERDAALARIAASPLPAPLAAALAAEIRDAAERRA